jgi:hypothetical protein
VCAAADPETPGCGRNVRGWGDVVQSQHLALGQTTTVGSNLGGNLDTTAAGEDFEAASSGITAQDNVLCFCYAVLCVHLTLLDVYVVQRY